MKRVPGMVGAALSITLALITACGENARPVVAPEPPRAAPEIAPVSFLSTEWNYYTGQEAIYSTGGYAGFDWPDAYRSTVFTVQRTLQPDNTWGTVMNFEQRLPFGPIPTDAVYDYDVARVETNDAHSYFRVYERSGALIDSYYSSPSGDVVSLGNPQIIPPDGSPMPTWPDLSERAPDPNAPPPCPDPQQITCPAMSVQAGLAPANADRDPRQWLDRIVVTTKSKARVASALERSFGRTSGKVSALDQYTKANGRVQMEVLVDPKLGAVVEENQAIDGELRSHSTYTYTEIEPGVLLRSASRVEIAPTRPGDKPRVIYTTLSNVKVGKINTGGAK